MTKIDIILDIEEEFIREPGTSFKEDRGDISLILHGISAYVTTQKYFDFEIDAKIGDPIIVLIEHYSDGDTFGTSENMDVKGVFKTLDEAEKARKAINISHGYFGSHIDFLFETTIIRDRK